MAAINGRTPSSFGQAFMPLTVSGGPSVVVGQPFRVRGWGIPTNPAWWDRPGKWNYWEDDPPCVHHGSVRCGCEPR
ncbi:hypothetical protein LCGC14_2430660 [marine sediment metagenome]|uniref:Uncharacterized protein n=1 Tax=marine sediment metagenome TaxID=412755 RepID=A0A0F9EFZ2_9ZZZZ